MKSSKFNSIINLNSIYCAIFNTLTEKYFVFKTEDSNDLKAILSSSSFSDTFSETKNIFYDKCIGGEFLVDDNKDEMLAYTKKMKAYNDGTKFNITLYNNEQNSNSLNFWLDLSNKICTLVEKASIKYRELQISWFITGEYTNFKFLSLLTDKFSDICSNNNCHYSSSILIHDKFPKHFESLLQKLVVNNIELEVSSCNYDIAKSFAENINLIFKIKKDIRIKLMINIYDDTVIYINEMLKSIDYNFREKLDILFYNCLEFSPELFLYKMYMTTINLGYKFSYLDTASSFISCLRKNSYCIDSDLNIASCVAAAKANDFFAKVKDDGSINIFNKPLYLSYLNSSSMDSYKCTYCPELPICLANYPYYRATNSFLCIKDLYNDLSLEQKIKLKILSDISISKELPQIL